MFTPGPGRRLIHWSAPDAIFAHEAGVQEHKYILSAHKCVMASSAEDRASHAQKQRQVALAAGTLATQAFIHYIEKCMDDPEIVDDATLRAYEATKSRKFPTPAQFKKKISKLVGRCEIAFKSSVCTDERVTRHSGILIEAASCAVVDKSVERSEDATTCMDMFEDILRSVDTSPSMPADGYGLRCNVEKEADELCTFFSVMHRVSTALVGITAKQRSFEKSETQDGARNVNDALQYVREMLMPECEQINKGTRQKLLCQMILNQRRSEIINERLGELKAKVAKHVQERVDRGKALLSADTLDYDCMLKVLEFVDYRSASACLGTCKSMRDEHEIRKLMPHLSFRHIPGVFPHKVAAGIDGGICNFVAKKALAHVYVDLAITGLRRHDEESVCLQSTRAQTLRDDTFFGRDERMMFAEEYKKMAARKAAEEVVHASRFRRRLCHESFFSTPIECSFSLVWADTHGDVSGCRGGPPLTLPKWMRKATAPSCTYTSRDGFPHPAHAAFHIEELSNDYTNRKFQLKVTGKARTLANENNDKDSVYMQTLVAYSQPFEIVSQKQVSFNVRKRVDEAKQRASKKQNKASA